MVAHQHTEMPDTNVEGSSTGAKESGHDVSSGAPSVATKSPEKFIPLTRFALLERLSMPDNWRPEDRDYIKRLFVNLGMWRHQEYCGRLTRLNEAYMPFSPDRDTIAIMDYSVGQLKSFQARLVRDLEKLLIQGNYQQLQEADLDAYFSADSPYGLNLKVDLGEFEEFLIFCRGAEVVEKQRRSWKKLFLGFETYEVPIFQRLFLMLKLKPEEVRVQEYMRADDISEKKARKNVMRGRKNLPEEASSDFIYLKLFKNIPQSDLEMLFPNTQVAFKLMDKIKLGVTAGGGTIAGIAGMATKLLAAFATLNLFAVIGVLVGLIGLIVRQVMKIFNQRTQYMMVLAQNLYFHSLADNRGVLTLMCDRAEEEDIKEEMLLYSYLTQYDVPRHMLGQAKQAIEAYLHQEFGLRIDYDIEDALSRLEKDGLVFEESGQLRALKPSAAVAHLETLWGKCLNDQPVLQS